MSLSTIGTRVVDLRSDSCSPPPARIRPGRDGGVDLYEEDRETLALESEAAALLGKEAGLFVASGVMGNQLGIAAITDEDAAVVAGTRSHIGMIETGRPLRRVHVVDDPTVNAFVPAVLDHAASHPRIGAIAIENTHAISGGIAHSSDVFAPLRASGVPVHLDGARLMNAAVATGESLAELAHAATTVMLTLSKGFGAPVGSILAGPAEVIRDARRLRLAIGGGMAKPGYIAAAARAALKRPPSSFLRDHEHAARLRAALELRWPGATWGVGRPTNLVIFSTPDPAAIVTEFRKASILALPFGNAAVRLVTHGGIRSSDIARVIRTIKQL